MNNLKRTVIAFGLILTVLQLCFAQQFVLLPPVSMPEKIIIPGTILERGVLNTGKKPIEFFQIGEEGFEYRYLNDSLRIASIIPLFTGDSILFFRQLLDNDTRIYKSTKFMNIHLIYDAWKAMNPDDALSYQLSPIAGDRLPFQQCYQYTVKSGYNAGRVMGLHNFSNVAFRGHNVLNVNIFGESTLRDNDPMTFGCTQPDKTTASGLLSVSNAANYPLKITQGYSYMFPNGMDSIISYGQDVSKYRSYFHPNYQEWPLSSSTPVYSAKGSNILCGGCSLKVYDYHFDKLLIDKSDSTIQRFSSEKNMFHWYLRYNSGQQGAADSIIQRLSTIIPIPIDTITAYFEDKKLKQTRRNTWRPHFYNANHYNVIHYYEIVVPSEHQDTIKLGTDLSFSYFVNRIETFNGPLVLKDSIINGVAEYNLYGKLAEGDSRYSNKIITLLDRGFIPPGVGARFKLYYNHLLEENEIKPTTFEQLRGNGLVAYERIIYPSWIQTAPTVNILK